MRNAKPIFENEIDAVLTLRLWHESDIELSQESKVNVSCPRTTRL